MKGDKFVEGKGIEIVFFFISAFVLERSFLSA